MPRKKKNVDDEEELKREMSGVGVSALDLDDCIGNLGASTQAAILLLLIYNAEYDRKFISNLLEKILILNGKVEFFRLLPYVLPFLNKINQLKLQKTVEIPLTLTTDERKILKALIICKTEKPSLREYLPYLLHALILLGEIFLS
jgi:hypothetical protein